MANCPNCGRKLHLFDWRPECPECGVNMIYYDANQRLLDESERVEIEHARFQPKVDRAKAAFFGSKFSIIRLVLTLLPIGALFLPLLQGKERLSVAVNDLFSAIGDVGYGNVLGGVLRDPLCLAVMLLLVSMVMIVVSIVLILMSLGKHAKLRVPITYGFMLLCAIGSAVVAAASGSRASEVFEKAGTGMRLGIGAYLYIGLLLVLFLYNLFLLKKGIPVKYTPCLIGGLPSEEYFRCVGSGMSKSQIQRRMLIAMAELEEEQEEKLKKEGAEQK